MSNTTKDIKTIDDVYTKEINKNIMNPCLKEAEREINKIIEMINKDADNPIPLYKANLLPE